MSDGRLPEFESAVQASCAAGDYKRAATLILEQLGPAVLAVLHARFRNVDLSGEVFSRFAESLWRGLPQFAFRSSVRVWVFTLARNAGHRYLERELRPARRGVPLSDAPSELTGAVERARTSTLPHLRTVNRQRLDTLRAALPEDDRLLLGLRLGQSLGYEELAQVFLGEGDHDRARITREAARLRKRMQQLKKTLQAALVPPSQDTPP